MLLKQHRSTYLVYFSFFWLYLDLIQARNVNLLLFFVSIAFRSLPRAPVASWCFIRNYILL